MQRKRYNKNIKRLVISIISVVLYFICLPGVANAQNLDTLGVKKSESVRSTQDSIGNTRLDSIAHTLTDSLALGQTESLAKPDSIVYTKPDSIDLAKLVELKIQGEEELIAQMYDSLWVASGYTLLPLDSLNLQNLAFPPVIYTKKELRRMHRDSVRAYVDSVIRHTPRVLDTYLFDDSTKYKRLFMWKADKYFNDQTVIPLDTSFNYHYTELPYQRDDAGANYVGVAGGAMQYHNYFKREKLDEFPFWEVYLPYSYTPETMPFYNTKTPYTELAYWGTLFANKQKAENNVKFLHTQNLTPSFNANVIYQRFGSEGFLDKESTDNRTFSLTGNYLGKKYVAQGGYIFNKVKRTENGGIADPKWVLDTLVDAKTIPIVLNNSAGNILRRNTVFLTHSYSFKFSKKQKDSTATDIDSLSLRDGTRAFIGHSFDMSIYSKKYIDNIGLSDSLARALYNNQFYINPTESADSNRVFQIENRVFLSLQPWDKNAIISKLDAGVGHQHISYYGFEPEHFITGNTTTKYDNLYMYFGAKGSLKKYFGWNAMARYDFMGYTQNDLLINGNIRFSSYPKKLKQGIHLLAGITVSNKRPSYFYNHLYTNHYCWNNNFNKTTETKIEAKLHIPDAKFEVFFGYSLLNNNVYLDSLAQARQNNSSMSVLTAYLRKDFRLWKFHFDNKILFQHSSNQEVLPLPKLSLDLRYYLEFYLVKNVLNIQLGANAIFATKYYAPGYNPALGMFYNQREEKIGGSPNIDVFVNLQWKRACIFVKYINAGQGWPNGDYFSAYRYIKPQKALKIGIFWPFYIK
ncbi:MAG: putative porin [Bacteroidia bacterium]|nr:putative porin [Bacteroidia bacterium]